jgi:CRISPR-associated Cas5-like protein
MRILTFRLKGEIAFWRDFEDSVGNLTCLGPAPTHLLGIIGACFGWSSTNQPHNQKGRAPWPYAEELLKWVGTNKPKVAARLLNRPRRTAMSVNGIKNAATLESTRIQQTVLEEPEYLIVVSIENEHAIKELAPALKSPKFRICMGSQFCPAFISNISESSTDQEENWATTAQTIGGDSTPLTVLDLKTPTNRLHKIGYWNYLPDSATRLSDALVHAYHAD